MLGFLSAKQAIARTGLGPERMSRFSLLCAKLICVNHQNLGLTLWRPIDVEADGQSGILFTLLAVLDSSCTH